MIVSLHNVLLRLVFFHSLCYPCSSSPLKKWNAPFCLNCFYNLKVAFKVKPFYRIQHQCRKICNYHPPCGTYHLTVIYATCFGLDLKCPSKARVLRVWCQCSNVRNSVLGKWLDHDDFVLTNELTHWWVYNMGALGRCWQLSSWDLVEGSGCSEQAFVLGHILSLAFFSLFLCFMASFLCPMFLPP
jgi:hypothetical protein